MKFHGVNVFGPVLVASGLGNAVRGHLRAMWHIGLRTRVFPFTLSAKQGVVDFALPSEPGHFDISIAYANADATDLFMSRYGSEFRRSRYRIGVWVWELPAADARYARCADEYDEIWVPSTFNRRAFSAFTRTPVHLVPYLVQTPSISGRNFRRELGIAANDFLFLYIFDASSYVERKNPQALLQAFADEFGNTDRVSLILKVSYLQQDSLEAEQFARMEQCFKNIRVIREVIPEEDVAALLSQADCYVSPHRTEGFGFTLAEAMVQGKPVIATDYGSTRDFVNEHTGFPVPYRLVEIERDMGAYPKGAVWAEVCREELGPAMKRILSEREEAGRRAKRGKETVRNQYGIEAVSQAIGRRLAQIPLVR